MLPGPAHQVSHLPHVLCHCVREPQGGPSQWGREPGELHSQRPQTCVGKDHSKRKRITAPRTRLRSRASHVALHLVILVVPFSCCSREMFSSSDNTENKKANNNVPFTYTWLVCTVCYIGFPVLSRTKYYKYIWSTPNLPIPFSILSFLRDTLLNFVYIFIVHFQYFYKRELRYL